MNDHAPTYTQHQFDAAYKQGWHDGHESAATQRAALQHEDWLDRLEAVEARLAELEAGRRGQREAT